MKLQVDKTQKELASARRTAVFVGSFFWFVGGPQLFVSPTNRLRLRHCEAVFRSCGSIIACLGSLIVTSCLCLCYLSPTCLTKCRDRHCSPYPSLAVGLVARISRITANTSNIGEFRFGAMLSGCVLAPTLGKPTHLHALCSAQSELGVQPPVGFWAPWTWPYPNKTREASIW